MAEGLKESGSSNVGLLDLILNYYHQKRTKDDYLIETRERCSGIRLMIENLLAEFLTARWLKDDIEEGEMERKIESEMERLRDNGGDTGDTKHKVIVTEEPRTKFH